MALEMVLNRKHKVVNHEYELDAPKYSLTLNHGGDEIKVKNPLEVKEEIFHWRNAYKIHDWFVENVQDGDTMGGEFLVTYEKLKSLRAFCMKMLEEKLDSVNDDPNVNMDEAQINMTIASLETIINEGKRFSARGHSNHLTYHSSIA